MGKVIASLVKERADCEIISGIDKITEKYDEFPIVENVFDLPEKPDVIIDFSHPSVLSDLLSYCKMNGVPLVIATTGYSDEERSKIAAAAAQTPIFFTFNMSLGINLLAELAKKAAQILGSQFDIEIVEKHHNQKKDAPSGTAIMLAEVINEELGNTKRYIYDRHSVRQPRGKDEIGMHSVRGGTIVGEHGDSAIIITSRCWCRTEDYWQVHFDLIEQVRAAFIEKNIEIPFNQLDVNITATPQK